MSRSSVIFGGSGFIGTHLTRRLVAEGQRVVSIDIKPPRERLNGVDYITSDVRDLSQLNLTGKVDRIYNLAAIHTTPGHPTHEYYETNVLGATEITAWARRNNIGEIVFTSSISVYGPSEEAKSESTKPTPESAYGWSKFLAERIQKNWMEEDSSRKLVICRPAVIFGHGEGGNFTRMAKLLKKGFFIYPGRKDTVKACFYVGDLLEAIEYAARNNQRFTLLNGCYPDRYTMEQIVDTFRQHHFPKAKTYLVPKFIVFTAAQLLRPFSALGLGIHPDRVMKLVRSTDIIPSWLAEQKQQKESALINALNQWGKESQGRFD